MSSKGDQDVLGSQSQTLSRESSETLRAAQGDGVAGLAGRELDVWIAEKIFGWQHARFKSGAVFFFSPETLATDYMQQEGFEVVATGGEDNARHYSTDIAAAWQIVEHFQKQGCMVSVNASSELANWWAVIYPARGGYFEEYGATAPEAICRAALQAASSLSGNNN